MNPDLTFGALMKKPKGTAKVERLERKSETDRETARWERAAKLMRLAEARKVRQAIYERDKGRCRCCGRDVAFESTKPAKAMHWHHIVYRSAGGPSTVENGLTVCWLCHKREHEHRYRIVGTGATVTITEKNLTTGKVIRQWESEAK